MGDGRIRAASNDVKTIGRLLEGKLYAEPLIGAAPQHRIDLLHPDSNDMDLLPPPEDDPYSEPLQITPDQLQQHCMAYPLIQLLATQDGPTLCFTPSAMTGLHRISKLV